MVDVARPGERIPIASDHAGFELKERLRVVLGELGYEVEDIGTHSTASTDYPDYAHPLSQQVSDGAVERGVLGGGCIVCVCVRCLGAAWVLLLEEELRVVRSGLEAVGG
jgi:RpiB/LacA/LacB family sugar-phosphate isomerase